MVKRLQVQSLGGEDPLEKEMATHSSTLAWKVPRTEERDRLQSTGHKESQTTERLHFHLSVVAKGAGFRVRQTLFQPQLSEQG